MKIERLVNLWLMLAGNPSGYTVKELASRFDVNIRTIYRDLEALGTDLKIPVTQDKTRWKLVEGYVLTANSVYYSGSP